MSEKHKRYSRQRGKKPNVCSGKKKAKGTTGLMLYLNKEGPLNKLLKGRHTASPLSQQRLWKKGLHPQSRSVPSFLPQVKRKGQDCCSVAQLCPTLCEPMDCSMPGFPVLHCLPEFVQTHVHSVGDAIQPPHHL